MKPLALVSALLLLLGEVSEAAKRSARWDAYLEEIRPKHAVIQTRQTPAECDPRLVTASDSLGRRSQAGVLSPPQYQGVCGNCWAFAAAHAFTDRLTLARGHPHEQISPHFPTACLTNKTLVTGGNGCCGGAINAGLIFFREVGAVTDTCVPYTLHSYRIPGGSSRSQFKADNPIDDFCPNTCVDDTQLEPGNLQLHGYKELWRTSDVITALRNDGPVIVAMRTSVTLTYLYECGVYTHPYPGSSINPDHDLDCGGYHGVEIVDYGTTDSGERFWVVKNSWGQSWGEGGYFRIRIGDLEIGRISPYYVPILAPNPANSTVTDPSSLPLVSSCAVEDITVPLRSMTLINAAVDVAINRLNNPSPLIQCRDNRPPTAIEFSRYLSGSKQVVAGLLLEIQFQVNLTGCGEPTLADVSARIFVSFNNTFSEPDISYEYSKGYTNRGYHLVVLLVLSSLCILVCVI